MARDTDQWLLNWDNNNFSRTLNYCTTFFKGSLRRLKWEKGLENIVSLSFWSVCCGWWVSHNNVRNNSDKNNSNVECNLKSYSVHLQDIASHVSNISDFNKFYSDGFTRCICKCKSERCQIKVAFLLKTGSLVLHLTEFFIVLHHVSLLTAIVILILFIFVHIFVFSSICWGDKSENKWKI